MDGVCAYCGNSFIKVTPTKTCSAECQINRLKKIRQEYRASYYKANKEKLKAKSNKWYNENKVKALEASAIYRLENPRVRQNSKLLSKYGITVEDYELLLEQQGYVCAICGDTCRDKRKRKLSVDHCHTTGKVRGLLCSPCNTALGLYQDNKDILLSAIMYLEEHDG